MNSILLIRLTSLGDVLLATPVVRALRTRFPHSAIDVAVDARFADVWKSNPFVTSVIAVQKDSEHCAVFQRQYDLVVDLQRNRRSARLLRMLPESSVSNVVRYSKHRMEKLALVYLKKQPKNVVHIVDRYLAPLLPLGVEPDDAGLELWVDGVARLPKTASRDTRSLRIGIAPGAQHFTKRYPPELYARAIEQLIESHNADVTLLGGTADVAQCDAIAAAVSSVIRRADGATSLADTAHVLDTLDVVISNDSAVVHMAAARGVPVIAIYGSTVPSLGFTPYGVPSQIVEATDVPCRPCTHIGRATCPKGHFACMNHIAPSQITDAVAALIGKGLS